MTCIIKNILLVGSGGSGKTTYMNRVKGYKFKPNYHYSTNGVDTDSQIHVNGIQFNVTEIAGQWIFAEYTKLFKGADAAIVFYSADSKLSRKAAIEWYTRVRNVCGDIPIIVCRTKIDLKQKQSKIIAPDVKHYFEIDNRCGTVFDEPFIWLATNLPSPREQRYIDRHE